MREAVLKEAVKMYNEQRGKELKLTAGDIETFKGLNMFGVSFDNLKEFLDPNLPQSKRDAWQADLTLPEGRVGIPYQARKSIDDKTTPRNKERLGGHLNDFQIWLEAFRQVANESHGDIMNKKTNGGAKEVDPQTIADLRAAMNSGRAIAVKADKNAPVWVVEDVFDNLQTMQHNKFTLLSSLKSEDEPTQ